MHHLFAGGEVIEDKVAQVLSIGHAEVHQEIILAAHVEQADHLGQHQNGIAKIVDDLAAVTGQLQGDHGLNVTTEGLIIDLAVRPFEHPVLLQLAYPFQTGGGSNPHQRGQILVGHACIPKQMGQDIQIQLIQISHLHSSNRSIF